MVFIHEVGDERKEINIRFFRTFDVLYCIHQPERTPLQDHQLEIETHEWMLTPKMFRSE